MTVQRPAEPTATARGGAPAGRPRSWREALSILHLLVPPLVYVLVGLWLTRGLWTDPGGRAAAANVHDVEQMAWWLRWTPWAIAHGVQPFHTALLNAPHGVNVLWNTALVPLGAVLAPVTTHSPMAGVTVLETAGPVLSAVSGWLVLRRLGLLNAAAAIGGLLFGFSPAMADHLQGHVNLLFQPLLPVLLLLCVRLVTAERTRWKLGLALGLLATLQYLLNEELLLLTGCAALLVLLALALSRPRAVPRQVRRAAPAYLLALLLFAVLTGPLIGYQVLGPGHGSGSPFTTAFFQADASAFVVPTHLQAIGGVSWHARSAFTRGGVTEQAAYLGWPLVALIVGLLVARWRDVRTRVCLIGAVVLEVFALGNRLYVNGHDTGIWMPWSLVMHVPLIENALAVRLSLLADLLIAAALAFSLDAWWRRGGWRRYAGWSVVILACVPAVPATLATTSVPAAPAFFASGAAPVAGQPGRGSVLVLPYPRAGETGPMRWQAVSGLSFPMLGGYFIGPAADGHLYVGGQPADSQALFVAIEDTGVVPSLTATLRDAVAADLAAHRVRAIVVGPGRHAAALRDFVADLTGVAPRRTGGVWLWTGLGALSR